MLELLLMSGSELLVGYGSSGLTVDEVGCGTFGQFSLASDNGMMVL